MSPASSLLLLVPLSLSLACGDAGGASDGASASEGASSITSASASGTPTTGATPTTGDLSASGGASTDGSMSGDADSHSDSETSAGTGTATTGGASTGEASSSTTAVTTASSSSDGTTGPGQTTGFETVPCQVEETKINPIPPDVLLVLDKSGSMSMESWDHDADAQTPTVTRWYSLHGVVSSIVTTFDTTVNFGMKLYPKIDAGSFENVGACIVNPGVEVEIAAQNANGVLAVLPGAEVDVLGGTPMETGLKEAYTYLQALDPSKQRFALLVADGEISKTCQGEVLNEALGAVKGAYAKGIPTYVVGIDVDGTTSAQLGALAAAAASRTPTTPTASTRPRARSSCRRRCSRSSTTPSAA